MNIKDKIYSNISYNTNELITKIDIALIAARDTKIIPSVNKKVIKTLTPSCTPFSEDQVYIDETKQIYEQNRDVFEDFYREHQELYSDISSELSKIKIKRKKK